MHFSYSSENSDEDKQDSKEDRMDEDTLPTQSDPNDLSAYNLDDYDNEAADTGIPM